MSNLENTLLELAQNGYSIEINPYQIRGDFLIHIFKNGRHIYSDMLSVDLKGVPLEFHLQQLRRSLEAEFSK